MLITPMLLISIWGYTEFAERQLEETTRHSLTTPGLFSHGNEMV
jgi:hypothetical protein